MQDIKEAKLVLEDGSVFIGRSFGYEKSCAGEVVFNTAMTGYPENLTDPSYYGQILVSTYPLVGNYGVPEDIKENGISAFFESDSIKVNGFIISDYSFKYSHWSAKTSLGSWLIKNKTPGIYGIDTRALTRLLRGKGSLKGKIIINNKNLDFFDPNKYNLVANVSTRKKEILGNGKYIIALIDCGVKNNILRCLLKRNTTILKIPWNYDFTNDPYDGVLISNGPGDPKMCVDTIRIIQKAMKMGKPIFGICLGNQLLSLAAGADTYKLKYGHRSHNQPVLRTGTNKCYISSQNHGFVLNNKTLPEGWQPLFINVNDGTNEGIRHKKKPFFSVQFHPEASSGPTDTEYLFDDFITLMKQNKKNIVEK